MLEKIIDFFQNKKVAILGFGREGKATYHFIRKYLPQLELTILDSNPVEILNDLNVSIITGEDYLNHLDQFDIIMKSPGISLNHMNIDSFKDNIYSQLELLLMFFKDHVIGITGTKGKSTTSTLIYEVLSEQLDSVYLVGNIGIPIFDRLDEFNDDAIIVAEMSSHQLEYVKYSPHIGIILNLYEDHLDHAVSVEHYHACKMNMFKYQSENDIAIYSNLNETLVSKIKEYNIKSKLYPVDMHSKFYVDDHKRNILGDHNLLNIHIVMMVANLFNLDLDKAKKKIDAFKGLEHRLEYVGEYDGVIYYNDTIATIPEATISGIKALKNVNTLIFGGLDRGINYQEFVSFLKDSSVENLICMPSTGYAIGALLEECSNKNIVYAPTLEEAVTQAKIVTKKGMICLLSPAASSYEYFKNFEEKGNKYKDLVKGL